MPCLCHMCVSGCQSDTHTLDGVALSGPTTQCHSADTGLYLCMCIQPTSRRPLTRGEVQAMAQRLQQQSSGGGRLATELLAAFASSEERCVCEEA